MMPTLYEIGAAGGRSAAQIVKHSGRMNSQTAWNAVFCIPERPVL
jgi:hypothetical protein